jgi:hypothetical protein
VSVLLWIHLSIGNTASNDTAFYVEYTVFRGDKESIVHAHIDADKPKKDDPLVIAEAHIDTETTMHTNFTRIPECYLENGSGISSRDYSYPTRSFYPDCSPPDMVDITIHFDSACDTSTYILTCDERRALVVDVNTTMVNETKTVKIKDGAFCTMTIENNFFKDITFNMTNKNESANPLSNINFLANQTKESWCVKCTVSQGDNGSIKYDTVVILQDTSNAERISSSFQMIPGCFPNTTTMYNDNDPTYKSSQSMINEGYLNCNEDDFREKKITIELFSNTNAERLVSYEVQDA